MDWRTLAKNSLGGREWKEAITRFFGDPKKSAGYIPIARTLLGGLVQQLSLGGIEFGQRIMNLPDGTKIRVLHNSGINIIEITTFTPTTVPELVELVFGIIGFPASDAALRGWHLVDDDEGGQVREKFEGNLNLLDDTETERWAEFIYSAKKGDAAAELKEITRDINKQSGNQFWFQPETNNVLSWWGSPHGDAPVRYVVYSYDRNGMAIVETSFPSGNQLPVHTPFLAYKVIEDRVSSFQDTYLVYVSDESVAIYDYKIISTKLYLNGGSFFNEGVSWTLGTRIGGACLLDDDSALVVRIVGIFENATLYRVYRDGTNKLVKNLYTSPAAIWFRDGRDPAARRPSMLWRWEFNSDVSELTTLVNFTKSIADYPEQLVGVRRLTFAIDITRDSENVIQSIIVNKTVEEDYVVAADYKVDSRESDSGNHLESVGVQGDPGNNSASYFGAYSVSGRFVGYVGKNSADHSRNYDQTSKLQSVLYESPISGDKIPYAFCYKNNELAFCWYKDNSHSESHYIENNYYSLDADLRVSIITYKNEGSYYTSTSVPNNNKYSNIHATAEERGEAKNSIDVQYDIDGYVLSFSGISSESSNATVYESNGTYDTRTATLTSYSDLSSDYGLVTAEFLDIKNKTVLISEYSYSTDRNSGYFANVDLNNHTDDSYTGNTQRLLALTYSLIVYSSNELLNNETLIEIKEDRNITSSSTPSDDVPEFIYNKIDEFGGFTLPGLLTADSDLGYTLGEKVTETLRWAGDRSQYFVPFSYNDNFDRINVDRLEVAKVFKNMLSYPLIPISGVLDYRSLAYISQPVAVINAVSLEIKSNLFPDETFSERKSFIRSNILGFEEQVISNIEDESPTENTNPTILPLGLF